MEIYVSTDVEADGPIPGPHSLLSFASAAFVIDRNARQFRQLGTFSRNLDPLPGAAGHPDTMAWWKENANAYQATRANTCAPDKAMPEYLAWLKELERTGPKRARCVFVAYPAAYDFLFVYGT